MKSSDIHIRTISQEMPQPSITKICLKITCLKFHSNFAGANELNSLPGHETMAQTECLHHGNTLHSVFNSLAPGRCGCYLKLVIFKLVSRINILSISCEIVLRWTPQDVTDDKSTLVQVMAWCHQATSHYLSQCWPRSVSPYGVTRPQWVKKKSCPIIRDDQNRSVRWLIIALQPSDWTSAKYQIYSDVTCISWCLKSPAS